MLIRVIRARSATQSSGGEASVGAGFRDGSESDYSDEDVVSSTAHRLTPREQAEAAMVEWEQLKYQGGITEKLGEGVRDITPDMLLKAWPTESTIDYWKQHGHRYYPLLAVVAMSVLAAEGGAAEIERDFSVSSLFLTGLKSSTDPVDIEMLMFCRRVLGGKTIVIPDDLAPFLKAMTGAEVEDYRLDLRRVPEDDDADDLDSDAGEDEDKADARFCGIMGDSDKEDSSEGEGSAGEGEDIEGDHSSVEELSDDHAVLPPATKRARM